MPSGLGAKRLYEIADRALPGVFTGYVPAQAPPLGPQNRPGETFGYLPAFEHPFDLLLEPFAFALRAIDYVKDKIPLLSLCRVFLGLYVTRSQ